MFPAIYEYTTLNIVNNIQHFQNVNLNLQNLPFKYIMQMQICHRYTVVVYN